MAYFGKEFKFYKQENFEEFVNSSPASEENKKKLIASTPTVKIVKDGDSYSITQYKPDHTTGTITFKSGVEFDEPITDSVVSKTVYTVDGNTVTQVQKTDVGTMTTKREFTDNECVATLTREGCDVVAKRYFKA